MRFHVINLPHTQTTRAFGWCAYTNKGRRFCDMMTDRGHEVTLYAGTKNDARVSELVEVLHGDPDPSAQINPTSWDRHHPLWAEVAAEVIPAIEERKKPEDFLCLITSAQSPIAEAHPELMAVEYGIGYEGTWAQFRVFESYAWMHSVLGMGGAFKADGRNYDVVIPNSYDPEEFPLGRGRGGYVLYIGRIIARKGVEVAVEAAKRARVKLIVAGEGPDMHLIPKSPDVKYVGLVGPERRAKLMGGAIATLVPTLYVEPFGGVAVESLMCGTPAITSDWGAFTETIQQGVTGYRCHDLGEWTWAIHHARELDREKIREVAHSRFSTAVAGDMYERYFHQLDGLRTPERDWFRADELRPYYT